MVTSLPVSNTVKPQICIDSEVGIYKKAFFFNEFIGFKVIRSNLSLLQKISQVSNQWLHHWHSKMLTLESIAKILGRSQHISSLQGGLL